MYSLAQIATALSLPSYPSFKDIGITELATDSRKIFFPGNTLFFAIPGTHKNGTEFIKDLVKKNVRAFVVPESFDGSEFPDAIFLPVKDVLHSLQSIAAMHRAQFHIPVVGITGSNGKTIVKELLFQLLYQRYSIVRSPKSYNSQLGVALSMWPLQRENSLAIFEAGISKAGEMRRLQEIIRPTIGIFTSIGDAHAEGFINRVEKIREKLKLFSGSKILFYPQDEIGLHEEIIDFVKNVNSGLQLFAWSKNEGSKLWLKKVHKEEQKSILQFQFENEIFNIEIPFTDEASIHNVALCTAFLLHFGWDAFSIHKQMLQLRPVEMRLEQKAGINNCTIINDTYNSDINSLGIALDYLSQQHQHEKKTLILSDIFQSAYSPPDLYEKVAAMVRQKNLYKFVGIGIQLCKYKSLFESIPNCTFYRSTDDFLETYDSAVYNNEAILLKAARVFAFEQISSALELQSHQTILEINLNAVLHNLQQYRSKLKTGVKLMVMVKGFSYGSGSFEIANLLQYAGTDYLAVAYADEGITLRKAGITLPIMVLNIDEASFYGLHKYNLEAEIFDLHLLRSYIQFLEIKNATNVPIHVKLDTGMHRLGFGEEDLPALSDILQANKSVVKVVSVFSHLVASDNRAEDEFSQKQASLLLQMCSKLQEVLGYDFIKHIGNTSSIAALPGLQMDMVRLGIGLYGVDSNIEMQGKLQNVTTLKTHISQIRKVKKGESVGYGRHAFLDQDSLIATVRIGYADGYRRGLGNGVGSMLLQGEAVPTVGNVCMDMTMLDVTGTKAKEGDEVIVFGEQLPVTQLAKWGNTIPYEILTSISQRVNRVYFQS